MKSKFKVLIFLIVFANQFKYFDYYSSVPLWYRTFSSTYKGIFIFNELLYAFFILYYLSIEINIYKPKDRFSLTFKWIVIFIASLACLPHIYIWSLYFYYAGIITYFLSAILYSVSYAMAIRFLIDN